MEKKQERIPFLFRGLSPQEREQYLAESGEEWSEENLERHLDSAGVPDPELIIRPGGEYRISNFLLWQSAYAEYVFSPKLWPDFQTEDIDDAIARYRTRDRRFGGVQT